MLLLDLNLLMLSIYGIELDNDSDNILKLSVYCLAHTAAKAVASLLGG